MLDGNFIEVEDRHLFWLKKEIQYFRKGLKKRDVLYVVYLAHKIVELVNRETSLSVSPFFWSLLLLSPKKERVGGEEEETSEV